MHQILEQVFQSFRYTITKLPKSKVVVEALLQMEKIAKNKKSQLDKQDQSHDTFHKLIGTWQLCFITYKRATCKPEKLVLGTGIFIPPWVKIHLSYSTNNLADGQGTVENFVELGLLKIVIKGPVQFYTRTNILAFDFTHMDAYLSGWQLYTGYIRNGIEREKHFYKKSIKEQAFFTYFLVENNFIAARGRGGGLALWIKSVNNI